MKLKEAVIPRGLKPQTLLAIFIAEQVYTENGFKLVLTSMGEGYKGDGVHGDNSYHYDGYAFDIRVRSGNYPSSEYPDHAMAVVMAQQIRQRIGAGYDVIFGEDVNHMNHMHIEYNSRQHESA